MRGELVYNQNGVFCPAQKSRRFRFIPPISYPAFRGKRHPASLYMESDPVCRRHRVLDHRRRFISPKQDGQPCFHPHFHGAVVDRLLYDARRNKSVKPFVQPQIHIEQNHFRKQEGFPP
jgi:hypothetical protein